MGSRPRTEDDPSAVIERLVKATNDHDLEALTMCFAEDYLNETPAHPSRGFRGRDQVRRNWQQIFGAVPDIKARVLRSVVVGRDVWTEWENSGVRRDGATFVMGGMILFSVEGAEIRSARFYLEPIDKEGGDVDAAVLRLTGEMAPDQSGGS